jgi:hypothetical protein
MPSNNGTDAEIPAGGFEPATEDWRRSTSSLQLRPRMWRLKAEG